MSIRKLFFISFSLILGACSSDLFLIHSGNMPTKERVNQVQIGQSKEDVAYILGSPSLVTGLNDNNWIYMSSTTKKIAFFDGKELERDILALTFKDNTLEKIEKFDLSDANDIAIDKDETKQVEDKEGFFRKYFGGATQYQMFGKGDEKGL
ncbi:MAG: outer membrane protein assembly factor BamE [Alphaproteobacteria bacterium]|nr:outer membrane protein assembly factor BamE [Alphaproteobacteria bacterium]